MTSTPHPPALSIRRRHPRWMQYYSLRKWQWLPWHMCLIGHGNPPIEKAPTHMQGLYQTHTQKSSAASDLLSFEGRTVILELPSQTGVSENSLTAFTQELERAASPTPFWTALTEHYEKHAQNEDERPHLQAASEACMKYFSTVTGLPRSHPALSRFDPGNVESAWEYAQLARLITLLSVADERPFRFALYCPRGDFEPHVGLGLNIYVPQEFLTGQGVLDTREVMVGITLGTADLVVDKPKALYVPLLVQEQFFSTMYVPTRTQSSAMYAHGRSCDLIL